MLHGATFCAVTGSREHPHILYSPTTLWALQWRFVCHFRTLSSPLRTLALAFLWLQPQRVWRTGGFPTAGKHHFRPIMFLAYTPYCSQAALRSLYACWQQCQYVDDQAVVCKVLVPVFAHVACDMHAEVRRSGLDIMGRVLQEVCDWPATSLTWKGFCRGESACSPRPLGLKGHKASVRSPALPALVV